MKPSPGAVWEGQGQAEEGQRSEREQSTGSRGQGGLEPSQRGVGDKVGGEDHGEHFGFPAREM